MSTNIQVQRICHHCSRVFTAKTSVTRFCSHTCSSRAYKANVKSLKIKLSNTETERIINQPIEELKAKEFLTVEEVANLLNCSKRTAYYYIGSGLIKAVNLGKRMIRVKRNEIDKLFI